MIGMPHGSFTPLLATVVPQQDDVCVAPQLLRLYQWLPSPTATTKPSSFTSNHDSWPFCAVGSCPMECTNALPYIVLRSSPSHRYEIVAVRTHARPYSEM